MIHPKTPSSSHQRQRKKGSTSSGRTVIGAVHTVRLDQRATAKIPTIDDEQSNVLGFFEAIEHAKAQAEMAKMLENEKNYPIAPDAFVPNSILRSMFKMKDVEPAEVKMFRLRWIPPSPSSITTSMNFNERLKRYSILTNFDGIHSTIFQSLNQIDILDNLQSKTNRNLNWQNDDDEWVELADPETSVVELRSKPTSAKKSKSGRPATSTLVSRQKFIDDFPREQIDYSILYTEDTLPEVFKRLKNESWWQYIDEEGEYNLRSMLLHLIDVLRDKEQESYESACNYVVEIFRTYGIEQSIVDQILSILTDHLALSENDPLDLYTVRAIAQFMMERKHIIIALLSFTSKCPPENILRQETINAIKFITDVNNSNDIELVLNHMPIVRDAAEDTFSLKTIIERILSKQEKVPSDLTTEEDEGDVLHPLLKKISEERWFPRNTNPITLDAVIDAILTKLPNASKTMLKTLTTHLVQLHRIFGYSNEQYDRVANGLFTLLSHNDADYRLIAATILGDLGRETKSVDLALLSSFLNDPRVLVRTECCESLKKLTGIMSETVLKDCADDISYLQTLPEENFSLQSYLKEKNRLSTPPPTTTTVTDKPSSVFVEERSDEKEEENNILPTHEDEYEKTDINIDSSTPPLPPISVGDRIDDVMSSVRSRSPSPHPRETPQIQRTQHFFQPVPSQFSITPSMHSSTTVLPPIEPSIRVEINEKTKPFIPVSQHTIHSRKEIPPPPPPPPPSSHPPRARRQPAEPFNQTSIKITVSDQSTGRRHLLLPNSTEMWDSYSKQNESDEELESHVLPSTDINQEQISDPVQTILEDHKHHIGYYRMRPNRPVLIPHKVTFDDVFADQSHMTLDRKIPFHALSHANTAMHLSDLNRNRRHLQEVEFVQLLSSLVIRAIQVHKKHERFIPGPYLTHAVSYTNFTDALTISQMQLHSPTSLEQASSYIQNRLPPIVQQRPSSAQIARMKTDAQIRAKRTGVNLRKAKDMEDALSHLLKNDREQSRSTFVPTNTPHLSNLAPTSDSNEVTHAWLLEQLLKSQGASDSQNYIHQIIRAYPKFTPLLHSRIPRELIPIIWNDPVLKRLAAIIGNKPDDSSTEDLSARHGYRKSSIPTFDDDHSSNFFDPTASNHLLNMQQQQREEQKKKYLPPIRGVKMHLPRHVLKFGFRQLESDSPETSVDSLRDETVSKTRRRRIYMHLMIVRHELVKNQFRHMLKTDYRSPSFVSIISRPPMYN